MKTRIEAIEKVLESGQRWNWREIGIEPTFGRAYLYSKEAKNELPNFADVIWEHDLEEIIACMKENKVTEFTISSTFSGLITTIAEMEKHGCHLEGITEINDRYAVNYDPGTENAKAMKIPAFRMSIQ